MNDKVVTVNVFRDTCMVYLVSLSFYAGMFAFAVWFLFGPLQLGLNLSQALMGGFLWMSFLSACGVRAAVTIIGVVEKNIKQVNPHIVHDRVKVFRGWRDVQIFLTGFSLVGLLLLVLFREQLMLTITQLMSHN